MSSLSQPAATQLTNNPIPSRRMPFIVRVFIASLFGIVFMQVLTPVITSSILRYGLLFVVYMMISLSFSKLVYKQ